MVEVVYHLIEQTLRCKSAAELGGKNFVQSPGTIIADFAFWFLTWREGSGGRTDPKAWKKRPLKPVFCLWERAYNPLFFSPSSVKAYNQKSKDLLNLTFTI